MPALEKVFSYLDWKSLGRAMLVCHRWQEVGGHPSLWTEFPLQVGGDTFPKIKRLDWVKSVTISLSDAGIESLANTIQAAIDTLPSLGELFILNDKVTYYPYDNHFVSLIQKFLKTDNNKLVRVGSRGMHGSGSSSNKRHQRCW